MDTLALILLAINLCAAVPLGAAAVAVRKHLAEGPPATSGDLLARAALDAGYGYAPSLDGTYEARDGDLTVVIASDRRPTIDGPRRFVVARIRLPPDTWLELAPIGDAELSRIATPFGEPAFDRRYATVGTIESRSRLHAGVRARLILLGQQLVKVRLRSGVLSVARRYGPGGPEVTGTGKVAVELARLLLAEPTDPIARVVARVRTERDLALRMTHFKHLARHHAADERVVALAQELLGDGEPVCRLAAAQVLGRADVALTIVTYRLAGAVVRRAAGLVVAKHGSGEEREEAARALTTLGPATCAAAAVPILAPLGADAEPLLLELFAFRPTVEVARRLGEIGTRAAVPVLQRAADGDRAGYVAAAARAAVARIQRQLGDVSGALSLVDPLGGELALADAGGQLSAAADEDPLAALDAVEAVPRDPPG